MKKISLLFSIVLLAGCAGTHPKGHSRVDEFDAIKVDQMVGNNVASAPLQKVILCLNARRESRPVSAITNVAVRSMTNVVVQAITNETVSIATNFLVTGMTNLAPLATGPGAAPLSDEAAAAAAATVSDTPAAATALAPAGAALGTNVTTSFAQNSSATAGPSQRGANSQIIRTYNNQLTTTSNNLSVSLMTNLVVTVETNAIVTFQTNYFVTAATNLIITPTNALASDYYLYTELIPPPDFVLQPSGESLVLLVDGVRHGLTATPPGAAFQARRGFSSAHFRVTPELLVAIANAQEVRLRLRGTSSVLERTMSRGARQNFKTFLVRFFTPETMDPAAPSAPTAGLDAPGAAPAGALANVR